MESEWTTDFDEPRTIKEHILKQKMKKRKEQELRKFENMYLEDVVDDVEMDITDDNFTSISQKLDNSTPSVSYVSLPIPYKDMLTHRSFWQSQCFASNGRGVNDVLNGNTPPESDVICSKNYNNPIMLRNWVPVLLNGKLCFEGIGNEGMKIASGSMLYRHSTKRFTDTLGDTYLLVGLVSGDKSLPAVVAETFRVGIPFNWEEEIRSAVRSPARKNGQCEKINSPQNYTYDFNQTMLKNANSTPLQIASSNCTKSSRSSKSYSIQQLERKIAKLQVMLQVAKERESFSDGSEFSAIESSERIRLNKSKPTPDNSVFKVPSSAPLSKVLFKKKYDNIQKQPIFKPQTNSNPTVTEKNYFQLNENNPDTVPNTKPKVMLIEARTDVTDTEAYNSFESDKSIPDILSNTSLKVKSAKGKIDADDSETDENIPDTLPNKKIQVKSIEMNSMFESDDGESFITAKNTNVSRNSQTNRNELIEANFHKNLNKIITIVLNKSNDNQVRNCNTSITNKMPSKTAKPPKKTEIKTYITRRNSMTRRDLFMKLTNELRTSQSNPRNVTSGESSKRENGARKSTNSKTHNMKTRNINYSETSSDDEDNDRTDTKNRTMIGQEIIILKNWRPEVETKIKCNCFVHIVGDKINNTGKILQRNVQSSEIIDRFTMDKILDTRDIVYILRGKLHDPKNVVPEKLKNILRDGFPINAFELMDSWYTEEGNLKRLNVSAEDFSIFEEEMHASGVVVEEPKENVRKSKRNKKNNTKENKKQKVTGKVKEIISSDNITRNLLRISPANDLNVSRFGRVRKSPLKFWEGERYVHVKDETFYEPPEKLPNRQKASYNNKVDVKKKKIVKSDAKKDKKKQKIDIVQVITGNEKLKKSSEDKVNKVRKKNCDNTNDKRKRNNCDSYGVVPLPQTISNDCYVLLEKIKIEKSKVADVKKKAMNKTATKRKCRSVDFSITDLVKYKQKKISVNKFFDINSDYSKNSEEGSATEQPIHAVSKKRKLFNEQEWLLELSKNPSRFNNSINQI